MLFQMDKVKDLNSEKVRFFRIDFNCWVWLKLFTRGSSLEWESDDLLSGDLGTLMKKSLSKLEDDLGETVKKAMAA
jgi:hypothetical protein